MDSADPGARDSGFVGQDDGLDSVAQAEFHEYARDMRLDCRFAEDQPICDFGIRQAVGHELEDLDLAWREFVEPAWGSGAAG